jgi:RNA polymerase sigma factor (sigma-70 family)
MEDTDPETLWRRFGAGDRGAFAALYRRHEEDVLRFCQALLRNPDDAREAANSTWASVWTARHAAERDIPFRPWLFRIAHNDAIDIVRRRRPHEALDVTMPAPDDTAADAELHERLATLHSDLLTLTDPQRTALVLREMSGLSHDEIAAFLGISSSAARQTIYEARQALIDAEGGRSRSCELVRRDISTGDRRVLRSRRIQAHLRGCAACREFEAAAERPRHDLRVLMLAPAGPTSSAHTVAGPNALRSEATSAHAKAGSDGGAGPPKSPPTAPPSSSQEPATPPSSGAGSPSASTDATPHPSDAKPGQGGR